MTNHLCLIVLIAVVVVDANSLGRSVSSEDVDPNESVSYTDESFPREDLIKMVQSHLLRQLNLSEDSLDAGPLPPIISNVVRILGNDEEGEQQLQKIVIRPRNNIFECFESDDQNCSRFEFDVTPEWNTVESLRVWFRKLDRTSPLDITVVFGGMSNVYHYDESDLNVIIEFGQIGFNIMKPSTMHQGRGTVHCTIEAKGASVHENDEDGPFLVITRNLEDPTGRQRRSPNSIQRTPCNCCVVDRNINVSELKMQKVVFYPAVMNIKACRGRCHMDQSAFDTMYGNLMYNLVKSNASIGDYIDEFWVPRCYPSKMESMGILYVDNANGQIVQSTVDALVVKSCSCMSYKCYSHR